MTGWRIVAKECGSERNNNRKHACTLSVHNGPEKDLESDLLGYFSGLPAALLGMQSKGASPTSFLAGLAET